jgi:CBS domain-containing protein
MVLIKEIKRAQTPEKQIRVRLTDLIQTSNSLHNYNNFAPESVQSNSILALGSPPARFAWLSIGSQGGKNNCCLLIRQLLVLKM